MRLQERWVDAAEIARAHVRRFAGGDGSFQLRLDCIEQRAVDVGLTCELALHKLVNEVIRHKLIMF